MPATYYFDVFDADHWTRDEVGLELGSDVDARHQAVLALTEMAAEALPNDHGAMDFIVRVRRRDMTAFTVRLAFQTDAGPALVDRSVIRRDHPYP